MLYSKIFLSAALFGAGIHATGSAPEGQVMVHVVQVGGAGGVLKFSPESLQAPPGSFVQFQFNPKNHSVVQSTFDKPCEPIGQTQPGTSGINSGFMPVAQGATEVPVFTIAINDTKPLWLYCGQAPHCSKGMVMAINAAATGNKTLEAYKAKAAAFQAPGGSSGGSGGYGSGSGGYGGGSGGYGGAMPTGTGGLGGVGPSATAGLSPSGTADGAPAEATTNAASSLSRRDATGLAALVIAAFALLG